MEIRRFSIAALAGFLTIVCAGCGKTRSSQTAYAASDVPAVSYQRHPMRGMVLGKSTVAQEVTVDQSAIRNFMPAMNAVYTVPDVASFRALQPGDQIAATVLAPSDGSDNRLANIAITAEPRHAMTPAELPPHQLLVGETVPDIPMVNQDGQALHFPQLRGKAVLLTFIDTRCTDDCPIITGLFEKVDHLLQKQPSAYASSELLSLTIDPANDKPAVLRKYGLHYLDGDAAGFAHWSFVDETPANLKKLATDFNVIYRPSKDDIIHTMTTALVAPDGTVVQAWDGDDWNPKEVAQAVAAAAAGSKGRL